MTRTRSSSVREVLSGIFSSPEQQETAYQLLMQAGLLPQEADSARQIEHVDPDLQRSARCGFPEVIFGEGKSTHTILQILQVQQECGQNSLVTRLRPEQIATILERFPEAVASETARTVRIDNSASPATGISPGPVFVVTAGTSDRQVAEEALETLRWMNVRCDLICDAGVAGPHRLLRHVPRLRTADAIVCVAGMEAALPSVLGGYVACPVIGVPTSVGYGASLQGLTAMLSMLTCCASNVVAVNIDAGFKGGYVAGMIAHGIARSRESARPESDPRPSAQ